MTCESTARPAPRLARTGGSNSSAVERLYQQRIERVERNPSCENIAKLAQAPGLSQPCRDRLARARLRRLTDPSANVFVTVLRCGVPVITREMAHLLERFERYPTNIDDSHGNARRAASGAAYEG